MQSYVQSEWVDKIRKDHRCGLPCNCTQGHGLQHDILRSARMLPNMDQRICCGNSSCHEDSQCSKRILVDTRCTGHQCNQVGNNKPQRCFADGIERSFHKVKDRRAVVDPQPSVRLKFMKFEFNYKSKH